MDFNDLEYDCHNSSVRLNNVSVNVYAHDNELLTHHVQKTIHIFDILYNSQILKNFYNNFCKDNLFSRSFDDFKKCILCMVAFHDIGKISPKFQINKLNKETDLNGTDLNKEQKRLLSDFLKTFEIDKSLDDFVNCFDQKHSLSGFLTFFAMFSKKFSNIDLFLLILSYVILGHHTHLRDIVSKLDINLSDEEYFTFSVLLLLNNVDSFSQIEKGIYSESFFQLKHKNELKSIKSIEFKDSFNSNLSFFYNYIYSLLISSDVFASSLSHLDVDDVKKESGFNKRINSELKNNMRKSFYSVNYNKDLSYEMFNDNLSSFSDINDLRKNMLLESSINLNKELSLSENSKKIFFLNMPTGGGKTNTSMKLALDLLELTEANRIIYAMPFINIIEQNYEVICNNYGLNEDNQEIRKIYSSTETIFDEGAENDEKSRIIIDDDFFNYPVICTTFVSLFNPIIKNNKKYKYRFSSLANSIIILDEIQSLPLKNWSSLYYLINELSEKLNVYFIIMSATLPSFDKLKLDSENILNYNNSLLISDPSKYFNHPLFDRTKVCGELNSFKIGSENLEEFLCDVLEDNFNINFNKGLIVLNTIKSSKVIYDLISKFKNQFNMDVDLLNSSLLPITQKELISKIKNLNNDSRYILVSTQSIEAGVDVSFDFVIRDFSTLDSIEQVRGRCNRSRELNNFDPDAKGNIYLINLQDDRKSFYKYIYADEEIETKINETQGILSDNINYNYDDILKYYDNISLKINNNTDKKESDFRFTDRENIKNWNILEYSKLKDKNNGISIIDNNLKQYSIFVPISVDIHNIKNIDDTIEYMDSESLKELYQNNKSNFFCSFKEIEYLKKIKSKEFRVIEDNYINGNELKNYYQKLLNESYGNIENYKFVNKEFSSLLSKFIINVTLTDEEAISKISNCDKLGYFYVLSENYIGDNEYSLYSIERGFNFKPLTENFL